MTTRCVGVLPEAAPAFPPLLHSALAQPSYRLGLPAAHGPETASVCIGGERRDTRLPCRPVHTNPHERSSSVSQEFDCFVAMAKDVRGGGGGLDPRMTCDRSLGTTCSSSPLGATDGTKGGKQEESAVSDVAREEEEAAGCYKVRLGLQWLNRPVPALACPVLTHRGCRLSTHDP